MTKEDKLGCNIEKTDSKCGKGGISSSSKRTWLKWPKTSKSLTVNVATLTLGSRPKQEGLQRCEPRGSLGVTSHTPKATPTLGDGVSLDFQNFKEQF